MFSLISKIVRKLKICKISVLYNLFIASSLLFVVGSLNGCKSSNHSNLKTIAIANLGPHTTLLTVIDGFKNEMQRLGYKPNENIRFVESHVNFDQSLIPTMLQKLKAEKPDLVVTLTTSVSQAARAAFKSTPLVFTAVTDPYEAKLVFKPASNHPSSQEKITGVSDLQNIQEVLKFIQKVLPTAKRIGIPFTPSEANDVSTLRAFKAEAATLGFEMVEIGVEHGRDIPIRIRTLKGKADCIYVTNSNIIQPALPAVISSANAIQLPVFNMSAEAVIQHQALGSYSVSYEKIGMKTAEIADHVLKGQDPTTVPPVFPDANEHQGFLSRKVLKKFNIPISKEIEEIPNIKIIGDSDA